MADTSLYFLRVDSNCDRLKEISCNQSDRSATVLIHGRSTGKTEVVQFPPRLNPITRINNCIFLISCVYYRSSWKYQNRSIRYCLLNSKHNLTVIAASTYIHKQNTQLITEFLEQIVYLSSNYWEIDCSGIGAFYDKGAPRISRNR